MTAATPRTQPFQARPPVAPAAEDAPGGISVFQQLGFAILILFLFLIYSRVFDVKFAYLHIPGLSYRVIFAMVLLSRAFLTALKSNIGKALLLFTIWFLLAIPFSVWRGGSTAAFKDGWLMAFVVYLATAGLTANYEQCRRAVYTVAAGLFVLTIIAILWGSMETGRLFLPHGKFENPNEMAQALLIGLPLWGLICLNARSFPAKAFAAGAMLVMLVTASRTGSRGALVAFAALIASIFFRASIAGKLKLMIGGFVLLAAIAATMPGKLLNRYTTLSEEQTIEDYSAAAQEDASLESNAVASAKSRKEMLKKSLQLTIRHPLFGVGPAMFMVAEDEAARAAGRRKGAWAGTHNSYTQVSSEMGIPALGFYVATIVFSLKGTSQLWKRTRDDPRLRSVSNTAVCLNYALIVFAVTIFFDHIAYTSLLPVLGGLSASLVRTAAAEIGRVTATEPARASFPAVRRVPARPGV